MIIIYFIQNTKNIKKMDQTELEFQSSQANINQKPQTVQAMHRIGNRVGKLVIDDYEDSQQSDNFKNQKIINNNNTLINTLQENQSIIGMKKQKKQAYKLKVVDLEESEQQSQVNTDDGLKKTKQQPKKSQRKKSINNYQQCSIAQSSESSSDDHGDIQNITHNSSTKKYMQQKQEQINDKQEADQKRNGVFYQSNTFLPKYHTYLVKRNQQWSTFNRLRPIFHCQHHRTKQSLFSAKLVSSNIHTTFILGEPGTQFIENGQNYIGKIKTNFLGNQVCIFGKGYSPKHAKQNDLPLRQMMATIIFETSFFKDPKPRSFEVYTLKKGIQYYNLYGTSKFEQQKLLSQLYTQQANRQFIHRYRNKKPQYDSVSKQYILDFGGRVTKSSMKNFILEDCVDVEIQEQSEVYLRTEQSQKNNILPTLRMLFGKVATDIFVMDIGEPIQPIIGFAIALSSFGNKIGCE